MSGSGFSHDIAGGQGNLIVKSVQSPNFVSGVSGWQIARSGNAQFNDVDIRGGTIEDGTALYYSPSPGTGNLIASISDAAGTDTYGNPYLAGIAEYTVVGGTTYAQEQTGSGVTVAIYPPGGPWTKYVQALQWNVSAGAADASFNVPLTATAGTASVRTLITTDTWHPMALLNGWVNAAGFAPA
ncbi:MAG TPA: hypothetical protein VNV62_18675, partial [Trebonia sp.]|nr:hypothetical protein [Trebonia sp.]